LISGIRVDSAIPWNSTGVIVSKTDVLEVTASGLVTYSSQGSSSPDGSTLLLETRQGADPEALGRSVARHLLDERGGASLLGRP
jgi:hypothetical protein